MAVLETKRMIAGGAAAVALLGIGGGIAIGRATAPEARTTIITGGTSSSAGGSFELPIGAVVCPQPNKKIPSARYHAPRYECRASDISVTVDGSEGGINPDLKSTIIVHKEARFYNERTKKLIRFDVTLPNTTDIQGQFGPGDNRFTETIKGLNAHDISLVTEGHGNVIVIYERPSNS